VVAGVTTPPIVTGQTQVDPAFWLNAANAAVRRECGWHVAPVITETLTLDGRGGTRLLLPSQRIAALAAVTNDGEDVISRVRFSRRAGILTLASGWSEDVGSIEVTLTHGHPIEEVPDVAALIVALTKRAAAAGVSAVAQQGIGSASVRYAIGADGAPLSLPLLASEKAALAPFVLNWEP
jgi:hypothetical protein